MLSTKVEVMLNEAVKFFSRLKLDWLKTTVEQKRKIMHPMRICTKCIWRMVGRQKKTALI